MTASAGADARGFPAMARLACIVTNISGGLAMLVRPPHPLHANFVPAWRRFGAVVALAIAAAAASMAWLDASAFAWASRLPTGFVDTAYQITDLGLSGWISGTDRRTGRPDNAPRFSGPRHHVAGSARDDGDADRVRVHRRRPARPRGHRRQAADRPGSSVHPRSVRLRAVVVAPGFCELSIRTYHDCLRGFGRLGHHFSPGTHRVVRLCAADRGEPRRGIGALSERRDRRRGLGHLRRPMGARLVRRAPAWFLRRIRRPGASNARAVMAAHQTGCRRPLGSLNNRDVPPREHPTGSRTFSCFP